MNRGFTVCANPTAAFKQKAPRGVTLRSRRPFKQVKAYVDALLCVLEGGWDLDDSPRFQVEPLEHTPVELCDAVAERLDALYAARGGDYARRCSALKGL